MNNEDPIGDEPRNPALHIIAMDRFWRDMLNKLTVNRHKAHWNATDQWHLLCRLREETDELDKALSNGTPEDIISECADVANFAMMIADNERTKAER